jgi:hypothetical protein
MLKPVIVAVSLAAAVVSLAAQAPPPAPASPMNQSQSGMADMMKMHEQMMTEMKAGDAKLDALVKSMNAATGEAKMSAIAQAVTELARQQKAMHEHMGMMMDSGMMMGGMGTMKK